MIDTETTTEEVEGIAAGEDRGEVLSADEVRARLLADRAAPEPDAPTVCREVEERLEREVPEPLGFAAFVAYCREIEGDVGFDAEDGRRFRFASSELPEFIDLLAARRPAATPDPAPPIAAEVGRIAAAVEALRDSAGRDLVAAIADDPVPALLREILAEVRRLGVRPVVAPISIEDATRAFAGGASTVPGIRVPVDGGGPREEDRKPRASRGRRPAVVVEEEDRFRLRRPGVVEEEVRPRAARAPRARAPRASDLAANMRWFRKAREWSQGRLGREAGLAQPTIANAESGRHLPRPETLDRIARAFGVTTEDLLARPAVETKPAADPRRTGGRGEDRGRRR